MSDSTTTPTPTPTPQKPITITVAGSTGAVGQEVVRQLLLTPSVDHVYALTRRPFFTDAANQSKLSFASSSNKFTEKIVNFDNLNAGDFHNSDVVFSCLGSTRKDAGSAEEFWKQDHDLIVKVATIASQVPTVKHFSLVSSVGADPKSSILYTKCKGQIEEDIKKLPFENFTIFRPAGILRENEHTVSKSRTIESVFKTVMFPFRPILRRFSPQYLDMSVNDIAKCMINDVFNRKQKGLLEVNGGGAMLAMANSSTSS
jgi:uncharacterized protein YbjT (DUF2867 family)